MRGALGVQAAGSLLQRLPRRGPGDYNGHVGVMKGLVGV